MKKYLYWVNPGLDFRFRQPAQMSNPTDDLWLISRGYKQVTYREYTAFKRASDERKAGW